MSEDTLENHLFYSDKLLVSSTYRQQMLYNVHVTLHVSFCLPPKRLTIILPVCRTTCNYVCALLAVAATKKTCCQQRFATKGR